MVVDGVKLRNPVFAVLICAIQTMLFPIEYQVLWNVDRFGRLFREPPPMFPVALSSSAVSPSLSTTSRSMQRTTSSNASTLFLVQVLARQYVSRWIDQLEVVPVTPNAIWFSR